jgi:hypothetical protein
VSSDGKTTKIATSYPKLYLPVSLLHNFHCKESIDLKAKLTSHPCLKACFYKTMCEHRSWDSIVGTVSRLQAALSCILIPVGEKLFSCAKCSDHLWGPPCLLFNVYWGSFKGVRWTQHKDDYSPPSSSKIKNEYSYTSAHPICLHSMDRIVTVYLFTYQNKNHKTWFFVCV